MYSKNKFISSSDFSTKEEKQVNQQTNKQNLNLACHHNAKNSIVMKLLA